MGIQIRKALLPLLGIFAVGVIAIGEYEQSLPSPQEALYQYQESHDLPDPNFQVNHILAEVLGKDEGYLFFLNGNGVVSVAFVSHGWYGWKCGGIVSGSHATLDHEPTAIKTGYTGAFGRITYGLIFSPAVMSVRIDGESASIIPLDTYNVRGEQRGAVRLWYIASDHLPNNPRIDYFNNKGEKISTLP